MIKLITEHKDYLLLVHTEAEIQTGKWFILAGKPYIFNYDGFNENSKKNSQGKLVAHLPLNNAPKLQGVPLLPELHKQEEDVRTLAIKAGYFPIPDQEHQHLAWIAGYKTASKKWNNEDIIKAYEQGTKAGRFHTSNETDEEYVRRNATEFLNTLQPISTPIGFEPELIGLQEQLEDMDKIPKVKYTYINNVPVKVTNGVLQGSYKF